MRRLALLAMLSISTIHPQDQESRESPVTSTAGEIVIGSGNGDPMATISDDGRVTISPGHTSDDVIRALVRIVREQSEDDSEQFRACMDGWGRAAILLQREMERGRGHESQTAPSSPKLIKLR
jgi:hypothetical protein